MAVAGRRGVAKASELQGIGAGGLTDASSAGDSECFACDGDVPWPRKSAPSGVA